MKKYIKSFLSAIILVIFLISAGGSSEGFLISIPVIIVIVIIAYLFQNIKIYDAEGERKKRRERVREIMKRKNEDKLLELKESFNAPITKYINYDSCHYILVSEEESLIMINEHIYQFKDILNYSLTDNSIEIFSPTTSKTTTDTGSMVGRAIVGGVLTGGAGAIIGGVTAKKTTETSGGTSHTKHDFTLNITVNSLSQPIERVSFKENVNDANEVCSLLSIILFRK